MQSHLLLRPALILIAATMLVACDAPEPSAYLNRGGPESLIDSSKEMVNLNVSSDTELEQLNDWVEKDRPTHAQLNCAAEAVHCANARKMLELQGVPVVVGDTQNGSVTLVYERLTLRDCEQRFINNTPNPYNASPENFGCSIASNIVNHVSDKHVFVKPNTLDPASAVRGVNDMHRAYKPRPIVDPYSVEEALTNQASSN